MRINDQILHNKDEFCCQKLMERSVKVHRLIGVNFEPIRCRIRLLLRSAPLGGRSKNSVARFLVQSYKALFVSTGPCVQC